MISWVTPSLFLLQKFLCPQNFAYKFFTFRLHFPRELIFTRQSDEAKNYYISIHLFPAKVIITIEQHDRGGTGISSRAFKLYSVQPKSTVKERFMFMDTCRDTWIYSDDRTEGIYSFTVLGMFRWQTFKISAL